MADQGVGLQGYLGLGFQTALGSAPATGSFHWLPFVSESLVLQAPRLQPSQVRLAHDEPFTYPGLRTVAGDIVLEPSAYSLAVALYAGLGLISTSSDTGFNLHTILPRSTVWNAKCALNPFTLRVARDISTALNYIDLVANAVTMEVTNGDLLRVTLSVIGGAAPTGVDDSSTPTFADSQGSLIPWNTCSLSIAGSGVDYIRSATISINNQLESRAALDGQLYPGRFKRAGFRQLRFSGALEMESMAEWNRLLGGANNAIVANFHVNSTNFATLTMSFGISEGVAFNVPGPGQLEASMNLRGHPDANAFLASVKTSVTLGIQN